MNNLMRAVCVAAVVWSSQAQAGVIGAGTTTVDESGAVVNYTVGLGGFYDIFVYGANGGSGYTQPGGLGAALGGKFLLTAGQTLDVLVGQAGAGGDFGVGGGGGGGGSFVVLAGSGAPLIIAGGGGGGAGAVYTTSPAGSGQAPGSGGGAGVTGGTDGGGGGGGYAGGFGNGGDGGYQMRSGHDGTVTGSGLGGAGFFGGGTGGFGGGGGGGGTGGGGGGGYSGGKGGDIYANSSLGGVSFLAPGVSDLLAPGALNALDLGGNGEAVFTYIGPAAPEPSTWAMMLLGFAGLGYFAYRRKDKPAFCAA